MRCSKRLLCTSISSSASVFRSHIHQSPCVICDGAVAEITAGSVNQIQEKSQSLPKINSGVIPPSHSRHGVDRSIVKKSYDRSGTISEQRKQALQEWMENKWENSLAEEKMDDNALLEKSWKIFCDPTQKVSDDDIIAVVEYLDRCCEVKFKETSTEELCSSSQKEVQEDLLGLSTNNMKNINNKTEDNAFLSRIKTCLTNPAEIEHQLRFQRTLLDFRSVANDIQLPFFLACGTALGAHREGFFIPHDNDIDIGIFYEELKRMKSTKEEGDIQSAVVELLSHVAIDGRFILFDICGEVEKGLELRFLHHETRIALDVNIYYPPLLDDDDDAAFVAKRGPFVWAATHYEDAAVRLHGMYRYHHTPFQSDLKCMPFCDNNDGSLSGNGFFVPPESYLVECYGDDWRTPRKYTYAEAIQKGEYKNLIEE